MKFKTFFLFALLLVFSNQSFALAVDEWEYKTITGDLKPTPGCKNKEAAKKKASSGHRFKKYTRLLCTQVAYGWGIAEVENKGKLVCDACEGEYEGEEKYRCYMKDVVVKCKTVKKGW
ncbi:MAG: hypothetical protein KAT04_07490 [Methylococcales bacterium]|nr:hypothetical protein [Methylococcales bacterium]